MKWTDIHDIAISLEEVHPDQDVINMRFDYLQRLILELPEFHDEPNRCNEKILEAIQQAWLDER